MKGATVFLMGLILGVAMATNPLVIIGNKYKLPNLVTNISLIHLRLRLICKKTSKQNATW